MNYVFGSVIIVLLLQLVISCGNKENNEKGYINTLQDEALFLSTLQEHLDAVSNKNLQALKSTMSPEGNMQLILPNSEIIYSVNKFIEFHKEWFQDTTWTFDYKIINTDIGQDIGIAVTEIMYREPNRNGKPYFNRMIVSYSLKKIDDNWYIIKDHASSIEKSNN